MQATLTWLSGRVDELTVPEPAPSFYYVADTSKLVSLKPPEPGPVEAKDMPATRFVLAGTQSGMAEYFEEGMAEADLAFFKADADYLAAKAQLEEDVYKFKLQYPDLKKYEEDIASLAQTNQPHDGETSFDYLKRLYDKHKMTLAAKEKKKAETQAAKAVQELDKIKAEIAKLKKLKLPKWVPATTTQAAPVQFGYEQGIYQPSISMESFDITPGQVIGPEELGKKYAEAQHKLEPPPMPELPEPEPKKARMIRLKKKG
jgi:hypothetical protein